MQGLSCFGRVGTRQLSLNRCVHGSVSEQASTVLAMRGVKRLSERNPRCFIQRQPCFRIWRQVWVVSMHVGQISVEGLIAAHTDCARQRILLRSGLWVQPPGACEGCFVGWLPAIG